jgi:hypothetical protein
VIVFLVLVCQRSNLQAAMYKMRSIKENFSQILPSVPLTGNYDEGQQGEL